MLSPHVSPPFTHSLIQTFIKNVLYIRLSPFILMFSVTTVGGGIIISIFKLGTEDHRSKTFPRGILQALRSQPR